jgi:hypothetical protein
MSGRDIPEVALMEAEILKPYFGMSRWLMEPSASSIRQMIPKNRRKLLAKNILAI